MNLKNLIRTIPDFPKKGILFRDITTLLNNRKAFKITVNRLANLFKDKKIDYIVCAEARGFILGGALAYKLGCGFVPVRKPGKLPYKSYKVSYGLEYGKDSFCIHRDAFPKGAKILIVDDLLATGGTAHAIVKLVRKLRGKIAGIVFLIELLPLRGRRKLKPYPVYSLIKF
ncbi:MAG: adenine phosphoribosyltransferase [Candidatus Omnitrophica bacterium]|nr:adenine phosphoribosyltransferase [Candidatus Omnitrophota bacterium]